RLVPVPAHPLASAGERHTPAGRGAGGDGARPCRADRRQRSRPCGLPADAARHLRAALRARVGGDAHFGRRLRADRGGADFRLLDVWVNRPVWRSPIFSGERLVLLAGIPAAAGWPAPRGSASGATSCGFPTSRVAPIRSAGRSTGSWSTVECHHIV